MRFACILVPALLAACSSPAKLTVLAPEEAAQAVGAFAESVPNKLVTVETSAQPEADLATRKGPRAALVKDLTCGDCYQVDALGGGAYRVRGGSLLGLQYGLAELLEAGGFRFYHPRETLAPSSVSLPQGSDRFGRMFSPAKTLRGLHLHTLHPIEPFFDFWQPSPQHLDGARRVIDWLVKNRGNYIQWMALNDIVKDATVGAAWRDHTRAIIAYAHARGVKVGIGVELFHGGNLQNAYDLLTDADLTGGDTHPILQQRLDALLGDLGFDRVNLSFGEFFGADPDLFVQQVNNTYDALQAGHPGVEMTATVHVSNAPNLHVQYMGMDLLYYFLVQYANPAIVPWIHTVMYYDLFEDTGGAYLFQDFSLHRQFLLNYLQKHQRAAYFPESAYWVAWDNSVPQYLPIYLYTRWLDLQQIDAQSKTMGGDPLSEHVLFSTGWEWGYWQTDYLTLRETFEPHAQFEDAVAAMFAPYGDKGAKLATQIVALAKLQHDALIGQRLAPYLAGTDFLLEAGWKSGIVSQPPRPSFADFSQMAPADRDKVVQALTALTSSTTSVVNAVRDLDLPGDPFLDEIRDGVEIDVNRAAFISALYQGVGGSTDDALALADRALDSARTFVARRHAHLHDPEPARLLGEAANATVYPHGYLNTADTLCYWQRERGLFAQQILGASDEPPGCVLGF